MDVDIESDNFWIKALAINLNTDKQCILRTAQIIQENLPISTNTFAKWKMMASFEKKKIVKDHKVSILLFIREQV